MCDHGMTNATKHKTTPQHIDEYISAFPVPVQQKLQQLRTAVLHAAPEAKEMISYQMPAFYYHGMLVYFAAYSKHIGFYATPTGHAAFKSALSKYKTGKGSVQFPLNEPLPIKLIDKIVRFRVRENTIRQK